jgi:hypothetical protein
LVGSITKALKFSFVRVDDDALCIDKVNGDGAVVEDCPRVLETHVGPAGQCGEGSLVALAA